MKNLECRMKKHFRMNGPQFPVSSFFILPSAFIFICVHPCPSVVQLVGEHYKFEPRHGHRREFVAGGN